MLAHQAGAGRLSTRCCQMGTLQGIGCAPHINISRKCPRVFNMCAGWRRADAGMREKFEECPVSGRGTGVQLDQSL